MLHKASYEMAGLAGLMLISLLCLIADAWGAEAPPQLRGRVTDEQGKPLADALLSAWADAANELRDPTMAEGHSGADGSFLLDLPFADTHYTLWVRRLGHADRTLGVIPDGKAQIIELARQPRRTLSGTARDGDTGQPAAGAEVALIPEYGLARSLTAKADATGRFQFDDLPESLGQGVIFARLADKVSPAILVRSGDRETSLVLGAGARLSGRVMVMPDETPAPACVITLRPYYMSGFCLEKKTDADGRYEFANVPPGKYTLFALGDAVCEPTGGPAWQTDMPLNPGENGFRKVSVGRMATLKGVVVGPDGQPVVGAAVGVKAAQKEHGGVVWRTTRTGPAGEFSLSTGWLRNAENLVAYSPRQGLGREPAGDLVAGQTREGIVIRLSGAMRVRGTVTDPEGALIPGLTITVEDHPAPVVQAGAAFDLGWVPLRRTDEKEIVLAIRAPRPVQGDQAGRQDRTPVGDERFYHHRRLVIAAKPGAEVNVSEKLQRAEVILFEGQALNQAGEPAPEATVILFTGNATPDDLKDTLHPDFLSSDIKMGPRAAVLARTTADAGGRWKLRLVRESAEGAVMATWDRKWDGVSCSLGGEGADGATAIIPDVRLEPGKSRIEVALRLGPPPPAGTITCHIVDVAGAPLAGIALRAWGSAEQFVTDAAGHVVVMPARSPRGGGTGLWLVTKGWGILSPAAPNGQIRIEGKEGEAQDLRIVLGPRGTVTGSVQWDTGQPVTSYMVTCGDRSIAVADPQGAFKLTDASPGEQRVGVTSPDGTHASVTISVVPGGETPVALVIAKFRCVVLGQAREPDGRVGGQVVIRLSGLGFDATALPDEQGRFRFRAPQGRFTLSGQPLLRGVLETFEPLSVTVGPDDRELTVKYVKRDRSRTTAPPPRTRADFDREVGQITDVIWRRDDPVDKSLSWHALKSGLVLADARTLELKRYNELLGEKGIAPSAIAFGPDKVWLGTNKGLFAYDRAGGFWTRFAVGGNLVDVPVKAVSLTPEGKLTVTIALPGKTPRRFEYDAADSKWSQ
jgi:hypothetical protein